jgi:hypothetical protein
MAKNQPVASVRERPKLLFISRMKPEECPGRPGLTAQPAVCLWLQDVINTAAWHLLHNLQEHLGCEE